MLIQAYYKGKQKSSAIPAYNAHTNGKLDAKAFYFHFLRSPNAALSSATSRHRKASAPPRRAPSPSVNIHNVSSEAAESFNTHTSATKASLPQPVFSERTNRK